jgi:hypothetical protein
MKPAETVSVFAPILLVAVCALPLIVGSDCSWAVWVMRALSIEISSKTFIRLSHTLQFALCLTATTNLVQLVWRQAGKSMVGSHLERHRVTYLVLFAGLLLLVHPFAMVLSDLNVVEAKCAVGSGGTSWEFMCTLGGYALLVAAVVNSMRTLPEEEPLAPA